MCRCWFLFKKTFTNLIEFDSVFGAVKRHKKKFIHSDVVYFQPLTHDRLWLCVFKCVFHFHAWRIKFFANVFFFIYFLFFFCSVASSFHYSTEHKRKWQEQRKKRCFFSPFSVDSIQKDILCWVIFIYYTTENRIFDIIHGKCIFFSE